MAIYIYSHEIDDIKEDLKAIDGRIIRAEQTIAERGERIRAIEDATTHLNSDMGRINHELEALNSKLDRLIEQTMRAPAPRTNFGPLSYRDSELN